MLTNIFLKKNIEISKQKGTFDVNLVFTATLACIKRALFITKKGTFGPWNKIGEHLPPVPPVVPPLQFLRL